MTIRTHPYDSTKYLDTPTARAEYLAAALETKDHALIAQAIVAFTDAVMQENTRLRAEIAALKDDRDREGHA